MSFKPQKSIFAVNFKSSLQFYDKLFKFDSISKEFPHWTTDRLSVTLKDFEKKHSLTISHNKATYESDYYDKTTEKKFINLFINNITNFVDNGTFTRFGFRRFYLIDKNLPFSEIVKIINLKLYTSELNSLCKNPIDDSSITLTLNDNDLRLNVNLGPISKKEIPTYIKYNYEAHTDKKIDIRIIDIKKVFDSYPEAALFIDVDCSLSKDSMDDSDLSRFKALADTKIEEFVNALVSKIFKDKIKK